MKEYPDALKGIQMRSSSSSRNDEQNTEKLLQLDSNYHHSMETWEKQVPIDAKNNAITNKRIETQESKDSTQLEI